MNEQTANQLTAKPANQLTANNIYFKLLHFTARNTNDEHLNLQPINTHSV